MNTFLFVTGCLAIIVGIIHSILGEVLIFNRMRKGTIIPLDGGTVLKERNVRILWASWHIVTILGCGFGAILLWVSLLASEVPIGSFVNNVIMYSMLVASLIVLIATKGKHPGWMGLLGVAILVWLG